MAALARAGRIRAIGVSNLSAEQMRQARRILAEEGIPLAQGLPAGAYHDDPQRIRERPGMRKHLKAFRPEELESTRPLIEDLRWIVAAHEASPAEVALSWLLDAHGETVVAIPGASSAGQARRNARAMAPHLSAEELDTLTQRSGRLLAARVA
jgi:aryl-alcohol dehydrogenase-like predicted oxidoreductase